MHSGRFFSLLVLLAALGGGAVAAPPAEAPRIVIDPGHGGKDPGAVVRSLREKQVALSLAKKLAGTLEKKLGAKVSLTRAGDRFLTLADRNRVANRNRCDLFLSIHANSARNRRASGIEIYYLNRATDQASRRLADRENAGSPRPREELEEILSDLIQTASTEEAAELAGIMKKSLLRQLKRDGVREVRVKAALFYVLVGAKCPSLLIEAGFLTNGKDAGRLKSAQFQRRFAEAIAESVRLFLAGRKRVEHDL